MNTPQSVVFYEYYSYVREQKYGKSEFLLALIPPEISHNIITFIDYKDHKSGNISKIKSSQKIFGFSPFHLIMIEQESKIKMKRNNVFADKNHKRVKLKMKVFHIYSEFNTLLEPIWCSKNYKYYNKCLFFVKKNGSHNIFTKINVLTGKKYSNKIYSLV